MLNTNRKKWAGAVLAVLVLCLVAIPVCAKLHQGSAVRWLAVASILFGTTATITTVRAPNQPIPINSYNATVVIADGDDTPVVIALPSALSLKMKALGVDDTKLIFTLAPLVVHAATAGLALHYNGATTPAQLELAHAQGATSGCTVAVGVAIPTTNNAP